MTLFLLTALSAWVLGGLCFVALARQGTPLQNVMLVIFWPYHAWQHYRSTRRG